jgi:hypothetical protein
VAQILTIPDTTTGYSLSFVISEHPQFWYYEMGLTFISSIGDFYPSEFLEQWFQDNAIGAWHFSSGKGRLCLWFSSDIDAILFKLTFG